MRSILIIIILAWTNLSMAQILSQPKNQQNSIASEWRYSPDDTRMLEKLGAEIEQLTDEEARILGVTSGVRISRILIEGLFANLTPKPGFVITHVNKERIFNLDTLRHILENTEGPIVLRGFYDNLMGPNEGIGKMHVYQLRTKAAIQ